MHQRLQPVPPIYQPEAIAREIVRAARNAPRELWISHSALRAIIGILLLARLGDRIPATEGYGGQLTAEPARPDRPDNLFEPVSGDPGAHERFDRQAHHAVIGFNPTWLRLEAALMLFGVVASAAVLGRARWR